MNFIKLAEKYMMKGKSFFSVLIVVITGVLSGLFYLILNHGSVMQAQNDYISGTGMMGAFVTRADTQIDFLRLFLMVTVGVIVICFLMVGFLYLTNKKIAFKSLFNLLAFFLIFVIVGLIIGIALAFNFPNLSYVFILSMTFLGLLLLAFTLKYLFKLETNRIIYIMFLLVFLTLLILTVFLNFV